MAFAHPKPFGKKDSKCENLGRGGMKRWEENPQRHIKLTHSIVKLTGDLFIIFSRPKTTQSNQGAR